MKTWITHDKYQGNSLRSLFTRFIDVTTPPTPNLLRYFASIATSPNDQIKLNLLANVSGNVFYYIFIVTMHRYMYYKKSMQI